MIIENKRMANYNLWMEWVKQLKTSKGAKNFNSFPQRPLKDLILEGSRYYGTMCMGGLV